MSVQYVYNKFSKSWFDKECSHAKAVEIATHKVARGNNDLHNQEVFIP